MSVIDRLGETAKRSASAAAAAARKQLRRMRLEIRESRLEARVRREKTAIGEALYPQLASGELKSDLPEVQLALERIEALKAQLEENAAQLELLQAIPPAGEDD